MKEAITWRSQALSLVGRVHIARQCMASQLVYPLGYLRPDPAQLQQLSLPITRFVASANHPADAAPYSDRLFPCTAAFALPREEGGLGFPVLQCFSVAMQAKLIAQMPGVAVRPWQALVRHLLADPVTGLASWVVTQPSSVVLPAALGRLAGHVQCFAQLRVYRVITPAQQSYHSVMAEPLFHNPDIVFTSLAGGDAYSPAELLANVFVGPMAGWRRLQDVYDTLHTSPTPLSLAAHAAVALVMRAVSQPWQAHLLTHPPPDARWECAAVPGHPGYVARLVQHLVLTAAPRPHSSTSSSQAAEAATAAALATSLRVLPRGITVRHLGVPVAPGVDPGVVAHAAFAHRVGGLVKEAITWRSQALSLVGRVHIARQCMASQLVYPLGYLRPDPAQLQQLSLPITRFVASANHPADAAPYSDRLFPCTAAFALPREEGGLGFPVLQCFSVAMQAKLIAQMPGVAVRPWQALVRHLLADPVTGLASWVVTQPSSVVLPAALGRLAGHVQCFAQLRVYRVITPAQQSYHSVMAEPLFHNPDIVFTSLAGGDAYSPAELLANVFVGPMAGWRRLQDVYDTLHTSPTPLSLAAHAAVALVMRAVSQPWQAHLLTHPPPDARWECAAVPGHPGYVARLVQLAGDPVPDVFWAMSSGRLLPLLPGVVLPVGNVVVDVAALVWSPAAVVVLRKPTPRMSVAELAEQRQAPPHRPAWPRERWLLGPWASVWLDPTVWGWRAGRNTFDLTTYTVKAARLRLARQAWEAQDAKPNPSRGAPYSHAAGIWPRGWGIRPAAPAGGQRPQYDLTGITRLEDGWRSKFEEHGRVHHALGVGGLLPDERDAGPMPAVNSLAPLPQRPSPDQRRASQALRAAQLPGRHGRRVAVAAPAVPAVPPVGAVLVGAPAAPALHAAQGPGLVSTGVWGRLLDPALQVAHRVVAWQVLHGQLMVGAFKFYVAPHLSTPAAACCAACRAAGRPDQLETLTHVFMECPAVAPALDWLLNVYQSLTGEVAPRDPLILLADAAWHWRPAHPAMWRRLRVAFLGCAWALRCDQGAGLQARSIAVAVVDALTRGVQRDWRRTLGNVRAEAAGIVPTVWFRGRPPDLALPAFHKLWPSPGAWFVAAPGVRALQVRLSPAWPMPVPQVAPLAAAGPPAGPPAQGVAALAAGAVGPAAGAAGVAAAGAAGVADPVAPPLPGAAVAGAGEAPPRQLGPPAQ